MKLLKILTPIEAMREKCLDCTGQHPKEIFLCRLTNCRIWPYRMGRRPNIELSMEVLPPIPAIRAKCLDCSNGQPKEIRLCTAAKCHLLPYRMGRRPKIELNVEVEIEKSDMGRTEEEQRQEDLEPVSTG
jgi:hypothetical protein